ncbi:MAG: hypothetical protein WA071_02145 [Undibacterium umbellatum]|uniref:hypothetical protein n=1 Tax=Undibacterium umbellatum TaxID=2762300 RepID=UPI003BB513DD
MINPRNSSAQFLGPPISECSQGNIRQNRTSPGVGYTPTLAHRNGIRGGSSDGARRLGILNQAFASSTHGAEQNRVFASLTDEQIQENHQWLMSRNKITIGFQMLAPGSGHIGASMEVMRKILAILGPGKEATLEFSPESGVSEEKVSYLKEQLQNKFGHEFHHRSRVSGDPIELLIYGGCDSNPQALMHSTQCLIIQPPYFSVTSERSPCFIQRGTRTELSNISSNHIFALDPSELTTSDTAENWLANFDRELPGAKDWVLLYEGGTGEAQQKLNTMITELVKMNSPVLCVVIDKKAYEKECNAEAQGGYEPRENFLVKSRENVRLVLVDRLPPPVFKALIDKCTLPSLVSGANTANDFQVRNKPFLLPKGRYFSASEESSPYSKNFPHMLNMDNIYSRYKGQEYQGFFHELHGKNAAGYDRFELAIHEMRNILESGRKSASEA